MKNSLPKDKISSKILPTRYITTPKKEIFMKKFITVSLILSVTFSLFAANMDSKVRSVPKDAMEKVFKKPKEGLPMVVKHLTQNTNGVQAKVKVMHDWICDNIAYDTDMYFSGRISKQDYESVLKKKKGVCSGYTSVMNEMCRLAGIESIGIHGFSKGFGYNGKLGKEPDHEWNAIKINGKWQLVDVTWDAGHVDWKTWIKHYSDEWLFLPPEQFIYSHLPEKEEYQYLKTPITAEQFVKEPYVAGKFFKMGFSFGKNRPEYNTLISEATEFDFGIKQGGVAISSTIREKSSMQDVENAVWINRTGNTFSINFDVPDKKDYKAFIFAKKTSEENYGDRFPIAQFEQNFLPRAEQLVASKKITQKEYDFFKEAFFKVDENGYYYLHEDLFANARNQAIKKVFKSLEVSSGLLEPVLDFKLNAAESYTGFGNEMKYPTVYSSYDSASNTKLISPLGGTLKKGDKVKFEIASKDFSGIAVKVSDSLTPLKKDAKGVYSAELEIGEVDKVVVYGTRNNKNYSGLWFYEVK